MESHNDDDIENDCENIYGVRDGTLFVIDATLSMFINDPDNPYFVQCIKQYKEVLKRKLLWDRQDWIGLILFGTEIWNSDPETRHILTLQELTLPSIESLKEIMEIDEGNKWTYYRDIASTTAYPLYDVLWHAAQTFSAIHITMPTRRVIIFTSCDNPPCDDNEKHRIRVQATSYNDIDIQLLVVGLGENWNHDLFYKDLEMQYGNIDADDYNRISLKDIVEQVKLPSRNMAKLPWRLGENVIIDVTLRNLSVKTSYLKKENINKENNVPLTSHTYHVVDENDDVEVTGDRESQQAPVPILDIDIQRYQTFGGEKINFTSAEVRYLCATRDIGIDLICIKQISYHPLYHFEAPYFVIPDKTYRKDNKLLFGALLNKCDAKNLMIICAVTIRKHFATSLCSMIPNVKNGGFYLYKIPFKENVQNISEFFPEFIYDDNERKPPIVPSGVELLEQIIEKLSIEYNPELFSNPQIQVQHHIIEALALDLEKPECLPDDTLPNTDKMHKLVNGLLDEYDKIFVKGLDGIRDGPKVFPEKKHKEINKLKSSVFLENKIKEYIRTGQITNFTVLQLKHMLKTLGLKISGKKEELINRIEEHFN